MMHDAFRQVESPQDRAPAPPPPPPPPPLLPAPAVAVDGAHLARSARERSGAAAHRHGPGSAVLEGAPLPASAPASASTSDAPLCLLGHTLSPGVRDVLGRRKLLAQSSRPRRSTLSALITLPETSVQQLENSSAECVANLACCSLVEKVERALTGQAGQQPGPLPSLSSEELLARLPEDALMHPGLEAFQIPGDDPRLPLRGQQGVRLREGAEELAAGTFCGFYGGKTRFAIEDAEEKAALPQSTAEERLAAAERRLRLDVYSVGYSYNVLNHVEAGLGEELLQRAPQWPEDPYCLVSTAFDGGSLASLINAPQRDPLDYFLAVGGPARDPGCAPNCAVVEVLIGGWPFLALFTTADIEPGAELLYDYGAQYWAALREQEEDVAAAERELALTRELEDARRCMAEAAAGDGPALPSRKAARVSEERGASPGQARSRPRSRSPSSPQPSPPAAAARASAAAEAAAAVAAAAAEAAAGGQHPAPVQLEQRVSEPRGSGSLSQHSDPEALQPMVSLEEEEEKEEQQQASSVAGTALIEEDVIIIGDDEDSYGGTAGPEIIDLTSE